MKLSMGMVVAPNPNPPDIQISMDIHVFTHYVHEHNILERNNTTLLAFRQYFCNILAIIMWAMNRKKRKGDGMRASPLPAGPSPRRSRAGLLEGWKGGLPTKPSLRGGGHECSGNHGLRDLAGLW
jgi:hypothetical protein